MSGHMGTFLKTLFLLCALLLSGCGNSYPKLKRLKGDYIYWVATPDLIFIVKGDPKTGASTVIPDHIDRVAVSGATAFGHVTPSGQELAGDRTPETARGFFYLDLNTGEHRLGLSEEEWKTILLKRGLGAPKQQLKHTL
jgi:hypothetical protein